MKANIRRAATILVCMTVLAHTVYLQPRGRVRSLRSRQLYKVVNNDNRVGFIDNTGKLVIGFDRLPKETVAVRDFHDGRAVIYLNKETPDESKGNMNYTVGYIDTTGKIIIPARFEEAYDFSEGLAHVKGEGLNGFINPQGEVVIRLKEDMWPILDWLSYGFHEGFAAVGGESAGFIDRSGKFVFKGYTWAASFSEGLAAVAVGRGKEARYGFVNKKGEMVIKPRFEPLFRSHKQIRSLSRFSEGLASVKVGDVYGYIDKKGEFVIPPKFLFANDFSEGLACARLGDKTGYINKSGRWVIAPWVAPYMGGQFKEGLAPVSFGDAGGSAYIDRTGRVIIRGAGHEFVGGVAAVDGLPSSHLAPESGRGYIDKTGKYLWRPQ
ncbi:MAG: WG repeat-containing protein [Pyrinomonadaceae bacterium]|nr:WG repeat-containing protein [Pyrinomonadaceae bacterium]